MDITTQISNLNNWESRDNQIVKVFKFDTYLAGIDFVNMISLLAEKANHHPDMTVGYKQVTVSLTTHDNGKKVTEKDINLAKEIDNIYL